MRSELPKHVRPQTIVLIVATASLFLFALTASLIAYSVWDAEQPRALPNGYRVVTVNGDWHSIEYPGGSGGSGGISVPGRCVVIETGISGASIEVIGQIGVHGDVVYGTSVDGGAVRAMGQGYFIFNTKNTRLQVFRPSEWRAWSKELELLGVKTPPEVRSPRSLPRAK